MSVPSRAYQPKRSRARWRECAPSYICDVFDDGGNGDRYTVAFTGLEFSTDAARPAVHYLGMSGAPTHPQGISMWGALEPRDFARYRARNSRHRIRWLDLPENIRAHVVARVSE